MKNTKLIIAIVSILIILCVGVATAIFVPTTRNINVTKEKLKEIDAKELETAIVKEMKNSKLNVKIYPNDDDDLYIDTMFIEGTTFKDYISADIVCLKKGNVVGAVEVPCFKITADSNGKFESIEYTSEVFGNSEAVTPIIKKVFKDKYGIDMMIDGNTKYNREFNSMEKVINAGNIYEADSNILSLILSIMGEQDIKYGDDVPDNMKQYKTAIFGINL